jgi:hypothetical protein
MAKAPQSEERDGKWNEMLMCHVQQLLYDFRTKSLSKRGSLTPVVGGSLDESSRP